MGDEHHRYYQHTNFHHNQRGDPKFLVDLTWNDPYTSVRRNGLTCSTNNTDFKGIIFSYFNHIVVVPLCVLVTVIVRLSEANATSQPLAISLPSGDTCNLSFHSCITYHLPTINDNSDIFWYSNRFSNKCNKQHVDNCQQGKINRGRSEEK